MFSLVLLLAGSCYPQSSSDAKNIFTPIIGLVFITVVLYLLIKNRVFRKGFQSATPPHKENAEQEKTSSKAIILCCNKCNEEYVLGQNALVMTSFGLAGDFKLAHFSVHDSSFIDNFNDPDLVSSINGTWDDLDNSTKVFQTTEITRLRSLLSIGRSRWWKCGKCSKVQTYNSL